ncbi:thiamine phosphate synthase [Photobacterium japonica]|uniref:thiamine phosphate synthase n=1 Tax=Photobacterium japonica TaxID=2910235 RepID=UPI003D1527B0
MNTICLPDHLTPLLMHLEPLLAAADHYQLGEPVHLAWSESAVVDMDVDGRRFSVAFDATQPVNNEDGRYVYVVRDQWLAPYPTLAEIQQQVAISSHLVVCGLPTDSGCVDVWHHDGEARAVYCHHTGGSDAQRAMLLAALALDYPLEDAVTLARAYARRYVFETDGDAGGTWPVDRRLFPRPLTANHAEVDALGWQYTEVAVAAFAPVDRSKLALYPVVDSAEWVEQLLTCGVMTTQLRIKDPLAPALSSQIARIVAAGSSHQAQVFVNDYWQLAIDHGAYGVHLGQEDLTTADLAAIAAAGLRLGLSTHGYYEILRAAEFSPSYIALGHIFPTTTKTMPSKPQGLNRLALYHKLIGDAFPTVAIGGIDLSRVEKVWRTGVSSVAVVRAITQADDPALAVAAFQQVLVREHKGVPDHAQ